MTTTELIKAIAVVFQEAPSNAKWRIHNVWPVELAPCPNGIRLTWKTDLGKETCDIVPGKVREGDIIVTSNDYRHSFRFYHQNEGEVVLTCQIQFKEYR